MTGVITLHKTYADLCAKIFMTETISMNTVEGAFTYPAYRDLVVKYAQEGRTSGEISPVHINATSLNSHRMTRLEKTTVLIPELFNSVRAIKTQQNWMVIGETWCGDAAQIIPVLAIIAAQNPLLRMRVILRDANPDVMNAFLTNGARAIPKLIITDDKGEVLQTWGPRPTAIQKMVRDFKRDHPEVPHDEFVKNVQLWYTHDKTQAIQHDILDLLTNIKNKTEC